MFFRSTPSTSSSARAGGTSGSSSTDQCKFYPWTTCSPVRFGLPTPSSTTGRSPWPTTWPHLTSCCDWLTTARSSTPWGETLGADGFSHHWVFLSAFSCYGCSQNTVGAESGRSRWIFKLGKWAATEETALNHLCVTRSISVFELLTGDWVGCCQISCNSLSCPDIHYLRKLKKKKLH